MDFFFFFFFKPWLTVTYTSGLCKEGVSSGTSHTRSGP